MAKRMPSAHGDAPVVQHVCERGKSLKFSRVKGEIPRQAAVRELYTQAGATDQTVRRWTRTQSDMARQLEINGRRYRVLSEPHGAGWKAYVVEVQDDGSSDHLGIEASAETRGGADDAAERKLRRLLMAPRP